MLLRYDISITGAQAVDRALASIERRFIAHNQRVNRALAQGGGGAPRAGSTGRSGNVLTSVEREVRQQEQYWRRAHQRSADNRIREENRASAAAIRNVEREAREHERYWKRAHAASAKARARAEAQAAKEALAARRKFTSSTFGVVGSSVKGTLAATGAIGGTALGLAGGFAAAGAVQAEMSERAAASRLANQAGDPGLKEGLLKDARGVRGFSGGEALGAIEGFVTKTGDLQAARGLIQDLGKLSLATGTDFGEMGEAAGQAFNVIKDTIKDPQKQLEAVLDVMTTLAGQGNLGAVEIRDMASELAGLGAATRSFAGGPIELLKTMGAMAQTSVARGGASSAAEATTAVTRFAADLTKKPAQKALAAHGVNVFADKGKTQLKSPQEIMLDILEKTQGNMPQIEEILNAESAKALRGFSPLFLEAERKEKGSGRKAVLEEFGRFTGAGMSAQQISERAKSRLEDPDLQFKETMKAFNDQVGKELLPVLSQLVGEFSKFLPHVGYAAKRFADLAEAFAQDPVGGLAKLAAAKLAFDIAASAAASSGKRLTDALTNVASGVETTSSKLGAAGLGLELGISAATIIVTSGIINFEKGEAEAKSSGAKLNVIRDIERKAQAGQATSEDLKTATKLRDEIRDAEASARKPGMLEGAVSGILGGPEGTRKLMGGGLIDPDKAAETVLHPSRDTEVRTQSKMSAEADKAINALIVALEKNTKAQSSGAPLNRGNSPSPVVNK